MDFSAVLKYMDPSEIVFPRDRKFRSAFSCPLIKPWIDRCFNRQLALCLTSCNRVVVAPRR